MEPTNSRSQCGGQGFDPPLLHQLIPSPSITYKKQTNLEPRIIWREIDVTEAILLPNYLFLRWAILKKA